MLNLERLRVLEAVSATGSVRGAADTLHVTTSAVSQQLGRLEREIGQKLLERNGRGIRLTEADTVLAAHARRLLDQVERIEADLAERQGAVAGRLTIGAFATAARSLLPDALRRLRAEHPGLEVRMSEYEPTDAIPLVRRADLDIAVVQDWPAAPLVLPDGLCRQSLLDDPFDVALPADHPLATRETVTLPDLSTIDWISWTPGQICHDWLRQTLAELGTSPTIAHTASDHSTQLALVGAGMGAAIIPRLGRDPVPSTVRIVPIHPVPTRHVYAVWRTTADRRPAIRVAVDTLRAVTG
ncbi:LysR family transcriptional regulator [Actinosynnema sp. ALI-1.44]|uniref:LysR family transcriptional regulator n=1 Tax=Actinosynnema sp. ALI-1.44 TaxID=1933779 RepID=UPI00097C0725|nr:LysR family transcriptional regulator [Actinosynnema sp. ALI-1.44]ONI85346.1 LysR family transcriptional regulator [Actinosynnema sp. ALI-1.44]